jgi:hypothetical protein
MHENEWEEEHEGPGVSPQASSSCTSDSLALQGFPRAPSMEYTPLPTRAASEIREQVAAAQRHAKEQRSELGSVFGALQRHASETWAGKATRGSDAEPTTPPTVSADPSCMAHAPRPQSPSRVSSSPVNPLVKDSPRSLKRARQKENKRQHRVPGPYKAGKHTSAPGRDACEQALDDVRAILHPRRNNGKGHHPYPGDDLLRFRLELMEALLAVYTTKELGPGAGFLGWQASSLFVVKMRGRGKTLAESLRGWTREFLEDRAQLPINVYGS